MNLQIKQKALPSGAAHGTFPQGPFCVLRNCFFVLIKGQQKVERVCLAPGMSRTCPENGGTKRNRSYHVYPVTSGADVRPGRGERALGLHLSSGLIVSGSPKAFAPGTPRGNGVICMCMHGHACTAVAGLADLGRGFDVNLYSDRAEDARDLVRGIRDQCRLQCQSLI